MASALCAAADSCLLANTLLSDELVHRIEDRNIDNPATVLALVELIANLAVDTFKCFSKERFKEFDSNPADEACQSRVAILVYFSTLPVLNQLAELEKTCQKIKKQVNDRSSQKSLPREGCAAFFKSVLRELRISREVEFLLHARLLTVTCIRDTDAEGVRKVYSTISNLEKITKKIGSIDSSIRQCLFNQSQVTHSKHSIQYMHFLAKDELAKRMSREEQIFRPQLSNGYEPKHFSCHYFEVVTMLDQVEEKGVLIALKSIMRGAVPFAFFEEGRLLQERPSGDRMVLVVEGTLKGTPEQICGEVARTSIREVILADVAKGPPFDDKSTLDDLKIPEARRVIEGERRRALMTTFDLVHTYLNLVKYEDK